MRVKLIFDDWRDRNTGKSIYQTEKGIYLSAGVFHSGTTFNANMVLDNYHARELTEALRCGYVPVFIVSLP